VAATSPTLLDSSVQKGENTKERNVAEVCENSLQFYSTHLRLEGTRQWGSQVRKVGNMGTARYGEIPVKSRRKDGAGQN